MKGGVLCCVSGEGCGGGGGCVCKRVCVYMNERLCVYADVWAGMCLSFWYQFFSSFIFYYADLTFFDVLFYFHLFKNFRLSPT